MSDRAHALLSASGAHRWIHCPPSARLEDGYPDKDTEYTREGTEAHALAEAKLRHIYYGEPKPEKAEDIEMDRYTDEYVEFIKDKVLSYKNKPHIAIELRVDYSEYAPEGFGTADCVIVGDNTLTVVDLKYGKGVKVEAEDNPQIQLYALGAYEAYMALYDIQTVRMCIVQPRIAGGVSEWTVAINVLEAFGKYVKPIAQKAFKGEGDFEAGNWCRWCKVKAQCRERAEASVRLAGFIVEDPALIGLDEVGKYLTLGQEVATWLEDLKAFALKECLAGKNVTGWKAVAGRTSRNWINQDAAFKTLVDKGYTQEEMLWERKPLTVPKVEKLIGKKQYLEIEDELVEKSEGKPTLVPEADKRQAINKTDVFTVID
jgi:hypothetical protein